MEEFSVKLVRTLPEKSVATAPLDDKDSWRDKAECLSADPDIFFSPSYQDEESAKDYCRHCPVTNECLTFADILDPSGYTRLAPYGVYGGLTAKERGAMRRKKAS